MFPAKEIKGLEFVCEIPLSPSTFDELMTKLRRWGYEYMIVKNRPEGDDDGIHIGQGIFLSRSRTATAHVVHQT